MAWTIEQPTVADADELGRVHVAIWRHAYAGLMAAEYLDGLDVVAFAAKWHERLADALPGTVRLVVRDDEGIVGFSTAGPPRIDDAGPLPRSARACPPRLRHRVFPPHSLAQGLASFVSPDAMGAADLVARLRVSASRSDSANRGPTASEVA